MGTKGFEVESSSFFFAARSMRWELEEREGQGCQHEGENEVENYKQEQLL